MSYLLQITEANHSENAFYTLGGAGFETEAERTANLRRISRELSGHICDNEDRCYMLDVLDPEDDFSVVDEFEISEATAKTLLGVTDLTGLRDAERAHVEALENQGSAAA